MEHPLLGRRSFLRTAGLAAAAAGFQGCSLPPGQVQSQPNFIIVFTDDQGYSDLGCYGATDIATPNIDRLAREGMKYTSFYSQPACGPARTALLTGSYPARVMRGKWTLNPDEVTLAEVLKSAGYRTGLIGKWDLSERLYSSERHPNNQGFDVFCGSLGANDEGRVALWKDHQRVGNVTDMGGLTRFYTDRAIDFMRQSQDGPFFLYLAHAMPHVKLGASSEFHGRSRRGLYGDVIEELDHEFGRLMEALKELGLDDNTIVLFASDNGPWLSKGKESGSSAPLRGGKGTAWEGGYRVPGIFWGPRYIPAGQTTDELMTTLDILPTFASLAGASVPRDRIIDGVNQRALVLGESNESARKTFYYYVRNELQAVRLGKWKMRLPNCTDDYGFATVKPYVPTHQLHDLEADKEEKADLAAKYPAVLEQLKKLAEVARADIGDRGVEGPGIRWKESSQGQ